MHHLHGVQLPQAQSQPSTASASLSSLLAQQQGLIHKSSFGRRAYTAAKPCLLGFPFAGLIFATRLRFSHALLHGQIAERHHALFFRTDDFPQRLTLAKRWRDALRDAPKFTHASTILPPSAPSMRWIEPAYSSGVVALADTSLQGRFGCVLAEKLALVDKKPATCGVKANSRWKVSGFQDRKAKEWQKLETKGTPHSPLRRKSNPFMFEIIESETGTTCFHTVSCQLTALNTTGYCIPDQTGAAFGTLLQSSLKLKLARTCCPCLLSCLSCLPVFVRVCVLASYRMFMPP